MCSYVSGFEFRVWGLLRKYKADVTLKAPHHVT